MTRLPLDHPLAPRTDYREEKGYAGMKGELYLNGERVARIEKIEGWSLSTTTIPITGIATTCRFPRGYTEEYLSKPPKPTATVLTCQNCGAPLEPEEGKGQVRCGYCGVVSVVQRLEGLLPGVTGVRR